MYGGTIFIRILNVHYITDLAGAIDLWYSVHWVIDIVVLKPLFFLIFNLVQFNRFNSNLFIPILKIKSSPFMPAKFAYITLSFNCLFILSARSVLPQFSKFSYDKLWSNCWSRFCSSYLFILLNLNSVFSWLSFFRNSFRGSLNSKYQIQQ